MGMVDWNPEAYVESSTAQESWGMALHARLALGGDETVVDLGCGDGRLTARLAARVPRGRVIGLDSSPAMVAHARAAWADVPNLEFLQANATSFRVEVPVDAIVSNAVLHWVRDLDSVFVSCRRALKPGGRILFQMGGVGNTSILVDAAGVVLARQLWRVWFPSGMPRIWTMRSPDEARNGAHAAGLQMVRAELLPRDMAHADPEAMLDWMRSTWFSVVANAPDDRRDRLLREIRDAYLEVVPPDSQGRTHVAMVRLEVEAFAPGLGGVRP